eukprot:6456801-Amphidinium_carterae.1
MPHDGGPTSTCFVIRDDYGVARFRNEEQHMTSVHLSQFTVSLYTFLALVEGSLSGQINAIVDRTWVE